MDSITQAALGAAVGEAVLGEKIGHKAAILVAIGGTIADLDVLTIPFFGLLLSSMLAAAAMSFSSLSVIINALILRKVTI